MKEGEKRLKEGREGNKGRVDKVNEEWKEGKDILLESVDEMEKEFGKEKMRTKDQGRRAEERIGTILSELHEEALIVFIGSAAERD